MKAIIKITKHGKSLDLIITKEAKKMGLKYGDYVTVTLEPALISEEITTVPKITKTAKVTPVTTPNTEEQPKNYFVKNHEDSESPENHDNHTTFDPSIMGEKIIKIMGSTEFSDTELESLIKRYDSNKTHVQAILGYIKENKK